MGVRRLLLVTTLFATSGIAATARAQEVVITGPLAGAPTIPLREPRRTFAIGGHLTGGDGAGAGLSFRVRPDARLAFDLFGELLRPRDDAAQLVTPVVLRLVGFQRLGEESDFILGIGPTLRSTRDGAHQWSTAFGFEGALGVESMSGWWSYRAELAGFMADDRGVRTQGVLLRLGVANLFGQRFRAE